MGYKLNNVIALYVDGVSDGLVIQAADKYLARCYVDHTSSDPDGKRHFVATYEPLVSRFSDRMVRPMRGFEDDSRVFLHSYQSFGRGQISRVCVDVFDTDEDDLITQRWNVTVPVVPTRSGRSQIDGSAEITDLDRTDDNKATILRFVEDVLIDGRWRGLEQYIDDAYAEHSPGVADGLVGLRHHLVHHAAAGTPVRYREPAVIVGCGNFVTTFGNADRGARRYEVFDVYRLVGGRIVEHWNAETPITDPSDSDGLIAGGDSGGQAGRTGGLVSTMQRSRADRQPVESLPPFNSAAGWAQSRDRARTRHRRSPTAELASTPGTGGEPPAVRAVCPR
jgi:predicted SnoaL-like aldol condensation-catalyzing enzyme